MSKWRRTHEDSASKHRTSGPCSKQVSLFGARETVTASPAHPLMGPDGKVADAEVKISCHITPHIALIERRPDSIMCEVCVESEELDIDTIERWVVDVSVVERFVEEKDASKLQDLHKRQLQLVKQYHAYLTCRDLKSPNPESALPWLALVEAIGTKMSHSPDYHASLERMKKAGLGIPRKQRRASAALFNAHNQVCGKSIAEGMADAVKLPYHKENTFFDARDTHLWRVTPAPLPYGPRVDDKSNQVEHWILWSSRSLYDPKHWSSEYEECVLKGVAGFVGMDGYRTPSGSLKTGYTGHSGVAEIEKAIAASFDPAEFACAWYINATRYQSVPGLPHVHLWVTSKTMQQILPKTSSAP